MRLVLFALESLRNLVLLRV